MRKGSITVFLSLVLVLLFSFLLTTLEAARLQGAKAYLTMVTDLAGDSFLAGYYYPLFRDYRLFAVNAGDEEGNFAMEAIQEEIQTNLVWGMEGAQGGLLRFEDTSAEISEYTTLVSGGEKEFLSQVKQQAVLDGLTLPLQELFSAEQIKEVGTVGEVYREQEDALEETAAVAAELLDLMELVDGVKVTNRGIAFDKAGNLRINYVFLKQILPLEKDEMKKLYENAEVGAAVSGQLFPAKQEAKDILNLLKKAEEYAEKISACESRIVGYNRRIEALEEKLDQLSSQEETEEAKEQETEEELERVKKARKEEKKKKNNYEEKRSDALTAAKTQYNGLKQKLQKILEKTKEAESVLDRIEMKQGIAQIAVEKYETLLSGKRNDLSEELYQTFSGELESMKYYAGLKENGIDTRQMRETLSANLLLLQELQLQGFSKGSLAVVKAEMQAIGSRIGQYTAEGLWFSYGELVAGKNSGEDVSGELKELLSQGVLSLVGIEEDTLSKNHLEGKELPSAGLKKENSPKELADCIAELLELFQTGEMQQILAGIQEAVSDKTALELYGRKYFGSYGEKKENTQLEYEREYLLFGEKRDKDNLRDMVLYLLAVRTLFCMVMILKQPDRMAELNSFATGVAGMTGIPVLVTIVKYSLLMLWAAEEALVEVSALLQGKKLPFMGRGCVDFREVFLFGKETVAQKAGQLPEAGSTSYSGYLTFFSLLKSTETKSYRAMDLIQENMRLRYSDGFRMKNQISVLSFCTYTKSKTLFDTGFFDLEVYTTEYRKEVCFGTCS